MGRSNKEIAQKLGISPSTAGTHVESLYRKLGVSTRAAAASIASKAGLVSEPTHPRNRNNSAQAAPVSAAASTSDQVKSGCQLGI